MARQTACEVFGLAAMQKTIHIAGRFRLRALRCHAQPGWPRTDSIRRAGPGSHVVQRGPARVTEGPIDGSAGACACVCVCVCVG